MNKGLVTWLKPESTCLASTRPSFQTTEHSSPSPPQKTLKKLNTKHDGGKAVCVCVVVVLGIEGNTVLKSGQIITIKQVFLLIFERQIITMVRDHLLTKLTVIKKSSNILRWQGTHRYPHILLED
jgi:hypothetical protein